MTVTLDVPADRAETLFDTLSRLADEARTTDRAVSDALDDLADEILRAALRSTVDVPETYRIAGVL